MLTTTVHKFIVISNQYDPVTDADNLLTRQELASSSLAEAEQLQQSLIEELKQTGLPYRCYIQERSCYYQQTGKKASTRVEKHTVVGVRNIIEIQGS